MQLVADNLHIINGFSLEPVKLEQILPLAKKYKVAIIRILASAGLSLALLNIFHDQTMAVGRACEPLVNSKVFS